MGDDIKPGNVVQLKSGGPGMTVEDVGRYQYDENLKASCRWFSGGKLEHGLFRLEMLTKVQQA